LRPRTLRAVLAVVAGIGVIAAVAGAWGLLGGSISFGPVIEGRIPFPMWVPGVILGLAVGGSMLLACLSAALNTRFTAEIALLAGAVTMGWIVVQIAIVGYISFLQPAVFTHGLIVLALGLSSRGARW
jgi:hypothetical protein